MIQVVANTITADMGLIPGLGFVGPGMGLPLSVLAAFIERPFYTKGGVEPQALWYSLQANLVSLAVGFVGVFVFGFVASAAGFGASDDAFFLAWPVLAVCTSAIVERAYIAGRLHSPRVSWGWSASGNVVSAGVSIGLLFFIVALRSACPQLAAWLRPAVWPLWWFSLTGSAALFIVAFAITRCRSGISRRMPAAA